ncbi:8-oxoguanine DNA glycosylase [Halomicroarcula limicola]|uniref:DNA-(apurinic or apyrimidinic site) lyase n=1 Tax=Haloarcula limicola TaxID=1429915 RepID=A0A8J7Y806_9EURY|nr:DNA-3-methyladenine glycosylase 2 family protein [Halomicroarcula limicola]MBV0923379.1 8-oxoguanine DNA glycosylase [Halomicroarcula limicola]
MERGTIDVTSLAGGLDLQATVESGQSYLWDREDGRMYEREAASGGDAWYWTTLRTDEGPVVVRVRQADGELVWESSIDAESRVRTLLGLDDDLPAIRETAPPDAVVEEAFDAYWGMRIVRDPAFPTLIAFICSAQMRVGRIHGMQRALRREFGETVSFDGRTYDAFPTPDALAAASEAELRDLNLGYRAPYVKRSAEMVANGEARPEDALGLEYEDARDALTAFVGVGDKVADCILLFSLGYLEAVPLDTWIRGTIEEYYPECDRGNYAETSRAIRETLGGEYAGYTQTYLFHYLRSGGRD